ncbi:MAG: hypothetical protein K2N28_03625 [Muribaculaceae bacterium]|nr:hypothetical protein [Muribaculaceae bacterium]
MVQDFLCFDTESAQGRYNHRFIEELLELSIMNAAHDEVFYSRFKPAKLSKWDTKVHHITPAMVAKAPRFVDCKAEVQRIFNSAKYIVGFSLIDDFKAVGNVGIVNLDKKKRVELRHLYWYCIGRHEDIPFYSGPGLSACAERLGVNIDADAVHSANGDTRVTLNLFFALMNMFVEQEHIPGGVPDADSDEFIALVERALDQISKAKVEYDRKMARGYIHVISHEVGGYRIVPSINPVRENNDAVVTIEVNARKRAAFELERMFEKRRILNTKNFRLSKDDLETIKHYTNEFDNQEPMYQRLLGLQRAMGGGKQ